MRARRSHRRDSQDDGVQQTAPAEAAHSTTDVLAPVLDPGTGHRFENVVVQRDGPSLLPPVPNVQLPPPSLLPPGGAAPRIGPDYRLKLDPALQQQALDFATARLAEDPLRAALLSVNLGTPPNAAGAPAAATAPTPAPAAPASAPAGPAGNDPAAPQPSPQPATAGSIISAIMATPEAMRLLTNIKQSVVVDWSKLYTGEKIAVVSTTASIAAGAIGGVLASPDARKWVIGQLNGKVIPVPAVPWLSLELNMADAGVMFGVHVDVGRLLPPSLGFGPATASPSPLSAPIQPDRDTATAPDDPTLAERIQQAAGRGSSLEKPAENALGNALGFDFSHVRIHADAESDRLATDLHARAFTVGSDIFFRSGGYSTGTHDGRRLLAHEAVHVQQQASGPVSSTPTPSGVSISDPSDRHERAAVAASSQVASAWDGMASSRAVRATPSADVATGSPTVQRDPLGPQAPANVDLSKTSLSFAASLPAERYIKKSLSVDVKTAEGGTRVSVTLSQNDITISFSPYLFVDPILFVKNADLYGMTYDFKTGAVTKVPMRLWALGADPSSEIHAAISAWFTSLLSGTRAGAKGYDPLADPDLMATFSAIQTNFNNAPDTSGVSANDKLKEKDLTDASVSATTALKNPFQAGTPDAMALLAAGSEITLTANTTGSLPDVRAQKPVPKLSSLGISFGSPPLKIQQKGKDVCTVSGLTVHPGGKVTVERFALLGEAAEMAGTEQGFWALLGILIVASGEAGPNPEKSMENYDTTPKVVPGIARASLESAFTAAVHDVIFQHRDAVPGIDLGEILGMPQKGDFNVPGGKSAAA